jgi:GNAT superfamily N-acetyltransferase
MRRRPGLAARIRPARPEEAAALSELAIRSKAHWGYDRAFLAACRDELAVTTDMITAAEVHVLEDAAGPAGFYRLTVAKGAGEVELLFVRSDALGQGVGRALWGHLRATAARRGAGEVRVSSDPFAVGFYEAMGCRRAGTAPSDSVADRVLPRLAQRLAPRGGRKGRPIPPGLRPPRAAWRSRRGST